eukprot:CAMPEP_0204533798 /NCGR_PEP_ID=MMETSP0661-20131031/12492_1 /ASSEMBLY_ACC=CAM_ASM_000606 /TAXON_ID=109239 /ORGANISM="Alexandrium margalefi, Strain AMGDE01CS-322" /LENGTH=293 /DNA_ID=CAMNT_0051540185 /DNA_START=65 /DNA_END=946 /DNA_ORIENTATION=+
MAAASTARMPLAMLLLPAVWWVAPTFIPLARGGARGAGMPDSFELQSSAPAPASAAAAAGTRAGATGLASLGLLALAVGVSSARRSQRRPATSRSFFGGAASPPPPKKEPQSYKDFSDPWLGAADLGFDPLNLAVKGGTFDTAATAVPETTYYNYRESEVKHGRFAMIAFLAIFAESADRNAVLRQLGNANVDDTLDATLGLDEVQLPVLLVGIGAQALAEYNLQKDEDDGNFLSVEYKADRIPGNLGFDPLGLGKGEGSDLVGLHNIEVNTGRLGMIGITSFLVKEYIAKDL